MKKGLILIADDNNNILTGLQIQLQAQGYEIVTCPNADLAIAYAQKHNPNVIITDIWMDAHRRMILSEAGNGFGVLERLLKFPETANIPVIYITGDASIQLDMRAKQLGAFGLIHKPINFAALLQMIESAMARRAIYLAAQPDKSSSWECKAF
jgi:CheY-like chemotaxis protein